MHSVVVTREFWNDEEYDDHQYEESEPRGDRHFHGALTGLAAQFLAAVIFLGHRRQCAYSGWRFPP